MHAGEHERAGELIRGRAEGSFGLLPMIPWCMALSLLSSAIQYAGPGAAMSTGDLGLAAMRTLAFAGMFCAGVGLGMRKRGVLTWRVDASGIAIDRPRRPLHVPWSRIAAVDETPEFFLVRLPTVGFYLPSARWAAPRAKANGAGRSRGPARPNRTSTLPDR